LTLALAAGALAVVLGVLLVNTLRAVARPEPPVSRPTIAIDVAAAAERLAEAVRFATVSPVRPEEIDAKAFLGLHDFLRTSFPGVHRVLRGEVVNDYSLLYTWAGTDPAANPIALMAHLDVVPVETPTEADWIEPPFSGRIADGFIWGRGSIDDKSAVLGILEAVELLVGQGFRPTSTVYLAFGHDEESRRHDGAARIAALLQSRGVSLEYVNDEGMIIADRLVPGVADPVALIGTAEKGWLTLELRAGDTGGHASMPPPQTAIGTLAAAIQRLEAHPMPAALESPASELFASVAPAMPFLQRMIFANLWLFAPLVVRRLAAAPTSNAIVRTTAAVTVVTGGTRDNVLPKTATALVNFRILPGDTTASVMDYVRRVIGDPRISITALKREEPSPVSSCESASFRTVAATIRQVFPGVLVAPGLSVVRTDSSHFLGITEAVYRFRPLRFTADDLRRIHGTNERVAIDGHAALITFYVCLIQNSAS